MTAREDRGIGPDQRSIYQVIIKGQLGPESTEWLGASATELDQVGNTVLTAETKDQSELHGLLRKIRDLGMTLISINRLEDSEAPKPGGRPSKPRGPAARRRRNM